MPIAFAQVREDPLLDAWVVDQCTRAGLSQVGIIQVASGGCTAAVLAATPAVSSLHVVDPNPAQLALTRVKLWLLGRPPQERLAVLGHRAMPPSARAAAISSVLAQLDLPEHSLGPLAQVSSLGPDHAGRYELVFAALRRSLRAAEGAIRELLLLSDPGEQRRRIAPGTELGRALDTAFAEVMELRHLEQLFGAKATGNAVQPFAQHFSGRLRHVLGTKPAASNPYVWQILAGRYPPDHPAPWLTLPRQEPSAHVSWTAGTMDDALASCAQAFHIVHLSNILDWLSAAEAKRTLELAHRALIPGGWVIIRQLNSSLDIPAMESAFAWQPEASAALLADDRSFFYRRVHVGRRR
jgi:S-adenosylmethionine-diacylglycerol 3-amino-3-carboxypropyl transferase